MPIMRLARKPEAERRFLVNALEELQKGYMAALAEYGHDIPKEQLVALASNQKHFSNAIKYAEDNDLTESFRSFRHLIPTIAIMINTRHSEDPAIKGHLNGLCQLYCSGIGADIRSSGQRKL